MPGGLRHVTRAAATVLFIALAIPATALAAGGGKCTASACKVYVEPNAPSAGKQQQPPPPAGGQTKSGGRKAHVPKNLARALQLAGNDKGPLRALITDSGLGSVARGDNAAAPGVLGAAFDLGAGPLVLLSVLFATAFGLAARGSVLGWLRRRSSV